MGSLFALVPAAYVYLIDGDRVLLQLRAGTGYLDGHWVAGAAGHVELGETAAAAAVREVAEEVGVVVSPDDLELVTVMQRTDGTDGPREQRVDWFWTCRSWRGVPSIREPHKCADLRWWPLDALPEVVSPYERVVLDGLRDGDLPAATHYGFRA